VKLRVKPAFLIDDDDGHSYALEKLLQLLRGLEIAGNLRGACLALDISYRSAWTLLGDMEQLFGGPVVDMTRGKGTTLTALGKKLVWAEKLIHARFDPLLESMAMEIDSEIQSSLHNAQRNLKIFASHGFAVASLNIYLQKTAAPIDVSYRGSVEALAAFRRGACEIAGFHVPIGDLEQQVFEEIRHLIKTDDVMIHIATRRQGLMVLKNNPKNIWGIDDLVRDDVVIVNRQLGSGTRVILDLLLARHGRLAADIAGFESEELTHAAIAAYVASGKADCGLGIETAARQFDLDFIPLLTERYFFLCAPTTLHDPRFKNTLDYLQSSQFRSVVSNLAGYDASSTGIVATPQQVFGDLMQ
jgi:molybdate transport repressor ModE-like protein